MFWPKELKNYTKWPVGIPPSRANPSPGPILFTQYNMSYPMFVPNLKFLGPVVPEKFDEKKKKKLHTHTLLRKRQKLYIPYILRVPGVWQWLCCTIYLTNQINKNQYFKNISFYCHATVYTGIN